MFVKTCSMKETAMKIGGKALRLGDDVSTDLIFPGKYLTMTDPAEQASHALEGFGDDWPRRLRNYTVLAAGWNLGCGSSREQAATALLAAGVKLVVARSLSRLFLRNCINNGLAVIESDELASVLTDGMSVSAELDSGVAQAAGHTIHFEPLPPELLQIVRDGGLMKRLRRSIESGAQA
jgi:3-isopropylmalate/(R)-2-methylmalate dehydratase small subunit